MNVYAVDLRLVFSLPVPIATLFHHSCMDLPIGYLLAYLLAAIVPTTTIADVFDDVDVTA